ncbi:unnamed protein product [Meloidogyne enterolobii]|uniref:Uncharacterized protein n=1 Tax=Meloidogyne enterolobii TaxID=390850 RepID=A0ACB0YD23_MELEN
MNFLAKHFFDYQSVINLPHTAVQMHKMPPSQAGCDPSAAWAPKDLHVSGKNHAAPAARANRGYHGGDQRTGSHRHGRPSKLEFRNWGERHGELRSEKIIPHTENWIEKEKDFIGREENNCSNCGGLSVAATAIIGPGPSLNNFQKQKLINYSSKRQPPPLPQSSLNKNKTKQQQKELFQKNILIILTLGEHFDFLTLTLKTLKGFWNLEKEKDIVINLRLFDSSKIVDERKKLISSKQQKEEEILEEKEEEEYLLGQSFLLKSPNYLRLPFCQLNINILFENFGGYYLLIGPSGSISKGNIHWKQMIKQPSFLT